MNVVVSAAFDDLRSKDMLFLEQAAGFGDLHVLIWNNESIKKITGEEPKFSQDERLYMLKAIRYVKEVTVLKEPANPDMLPDSLKTKPQIWVIDEKADNQIKQDYCKVHNLHYKVISEKNLKNFPDYDPSLLPNNSGKNKVVITGCFDWFHSGHVRFLEEVSEYGDLYAIVGHDRNIELLKGPGHPMFPQNQRRYVLQSIRYVKQALISTGDGWMDAEPEIMRIHADIYAVNEDGDKPEKRQFCQKHGIEYLVLKRLPKQGLKRRESTKLRGF